MNLQEWTVTYVQARDLIFRTLRDIREEKNKITFTFTDRTTTYLIRERLNQEVIKELDTAQNQTIVTRNTKENLQFLIKHWNDFTTHASLKIFFVNPRHNQYWAISPYHHNTIADKKTLKQGLNTLFHTVPEATP